MTMYLTHKPCMQIFSTKIMLFLPFILAKSEAMFLQVAFKFSHLNLKDHLDKDESCYCLQIQEQYTEVCTPLFGCLLASLILIC